MVISNFGYAISLCYTERLVGGYEWEKANYTTSTYQYEYGDL